MHEFVSDMLQASSEDLVEVREGMKKLALGSKANGKIIENASWMFNYFYTYCFVALDWYYLVFLHCVVSNPRWRTEKYV